MARSSSPLLLALTLVTGALVGMLLDRGSPYLAAQPPRGVASPVTGPSQVIPTTARGASDDALYVQLAQQYSQFEHVNRTFEMVARVVSPAVVHIVAQKTGRIDESSKVRHYEETGSGVIVRGDRIKGLYVLTNNHVVEGALPAKVRIFLQDGRALQPEAVWLDAKADIAVMNLNRDDLPAARLGNSDEIGVGAWVLALGSPFGLMHSVSQGIISARGRHMDELQDVENQDFLQTDAAINPGNSGGPLVNMKGEVVGINNSIASNGGGNEGVGFSIPINLARWIMNQLVTKGRVSRGALGIDLHPEFKVEDAVSLGLDRPRGAWVNEVHPGSPASAAGLHKGDVILKFGGVEVIDLNHLINMVSMAPIGEAAELEVWRSKQRFVLKVTVGDRERTIAAVTPAASRPFPAVPNRSARPGAASTALGIELQTLDDPAAQQLGLPLSLKGVVILKVDPGSPVARSLRPLDVIYEVNGRGVTTAEEAAKALSNQLAGRDGLVVRYDRVVKGAIERPDGPGPVNPALSHALKTLAAGRDLDADAAERAVDELLGGGVSEAVVAAFLTGLKVKGETEAELAGAVRAVRARVDDVGLELPASGVLDTCGTGGDGANTVNVSSATAVVVAACGVRVAKHGNRAASGNSGSSEVFEELGIATGASPRVLSRCLAEVGITFLFAPSFHPGLKHIAPVRRQLPFRTIFNLVGPLANPARPDFQLVGVAGERQADLVAGALARLGTCRAAVVTGADGLDEVSLSGPTRVLLVEGGEVYPLGWMPEDFGLGRVEVADLRVSGPSDSAARISHAFAGEPGPIRDMVVANTAAALWVAGEQDLKAGVRRAAEAIDGGGANRVLERWRGLSHERA